MNQSHENKIKKLEEKNQQYIKELIICQEKRSGHWKKYELEQEKNVKLHKQLNTTQSSIPFIILNFLFSPLGLFKRNKNNISAPINYQPTKSQYSSKVIDNKTLTSVNLSAESVLKVINWPVTRFYSDSRVVSILDEFSFTCLNKHCRMSTPRPDNWKEVTQLEQPHFLFVESAWQGNEGSWQYRVGTYASPPGNELQEMLVYYKSKGIPTIFWNKEDPVHFNNFINTAKQFDVILTTDKNIIPEYQKQAPQAQVHALPFAAEISLQNPIGSSERKNKVCFAGSFYANRFKERMDDQLMLLDAARSFDLDIYDRNYQADAEPIKDFQFPERFSKNIIGKLSYNEVITAYKQYKVFLNVNSVIDSPTMLSRRVYELLACGTPIVSTRSKAIEEQFGDELVWMVDNQEEAEHAIHTLLSDEKEWKKRSLKGVRHIMRNHTYDHRFKEIAHYAGLDKSLFSNNKTRALILVEVKTTIDFNNIIWAFKRQSWDNLHLLLVDPNKTATLHERDNTKVTIIENPSQLNETVNNLNQSCPIKFLTKWNNDVIYGKHYIEDMLYAANYSQAEIVVKPKNEIEQYNFSSNLNSTHYLINTDFIESMHFPYEYLLINNNDFITKAIKHGARIFSSDINNIIAIPPKTSFKDFDKLAESFEI